MSMPRELRFRGWDGEAMREPQDLSQSGEFWEWLGKMDIPIMQFTGLEDKNGVDIYEGDICNSSDGHKSRLDSVRPLVEIVSGHHPYIVETWHNAQTGYYQLSIDKVMERGGGKELTHTIDSLNGSYAKVIEVIGNIYENPELLEQS